MGSTRSLAALHQTVRADFEVSETYGYVERAPLTCPIAAFGGSEDTQVGEDEMRGWREMTTGCFRLVMLQGGHCFISENREALLGRWIDAVLRYMHIGKCVTSL
jgi:surfactin synthase thioesterase subunit